MSITRTYFDKNNTIISTPRNEVNTGRNPVTDIFYGVDVSRFLFYIDLNALRDRITDKTINVSSILRHTLKLKNTTDSDVMPYRDYNNQVRFSDKHHATSFDLELMPILEEWDEGMGYDADIITTEEDELTYVKTASNWDNRTAENVWVNEGSVQTGTTNIAIQHFDNGSEDLEMDITLFINQVLTGDTEYQGFCLKFTDFFEDKIESARKYVSFFTRHTHTFFEPFIETEYDDLVKDDRRNVVLNQPANLVLYTFKQGNLFNLDELPVCQINSTSFPVTQISKGIYSAEILLISPTYSDYVMYHDIWSNIIVNGVLQPTKRLDVTPKPSDYQYQIGSNTFEPIPYKISISGIKRDENITQGENRKVLVNLRKPYTVAIVDVVDNLYYRIYVKQGINQVTVVNWTEVNRAFDSNYFFVDTTWMVPQQYYIDIKLVIREETRLFNEEIKFSVISQLN